jgi:hypothetical protein
LRILFPKKKYKTKPTNGNTRSIKSHATVCAGFLFSKKITIPVRKTMKEKMYAIVAGTISKKD